MLSATSSKNHSLFSFGRHGKTSQPEQPAVTVNGPYEFLPSVSFDDLHTSIESASGNFNLTKLASTSLDLPRRDDSKMLEKPTVTPNGSTTRVNLHSMPARSSRSGRSGSILHRPSTAPRQTSSSSIVSSASSSTDATSASTAIRARRQAHYPPVSHNSSINISAKTPRKTMATGAVAEADPPVTRTASKRRLSLVSDRNAELARICTDGGSDPVRSGTVSGSSRSSKSVHPSPMHSQTSLVGSNALSSEQNRLSMPAKSPRGPIKPTTPSSGRRQSMAPGGHASHATGLGARTISPTDTRRLKRMSMMTQSSSLTHVNSVPPPPPPPPPISMDLRADSRSPSMIPRKTSGSGTPSSARTTPDVVRKSYSSGLSGGSTMSFNTVRTSTGSLQPRLSQSSSQSRLPAPKLTTMHNPLTAEDSEDVPPVPAIPKAYESPKDSSAEVGSVEKKKKSSLGMLDNTSSSNSSTTSIAMPSHTETVKLQRKQSTRKNVAATMMAAPEKKAKPQAKRSLEPSRLPPINLAPLPVPATVKPAAPQVQDTERDMSPPLSRQLPKTPTTPMTASKSSFFSKVGYDESIEMPSFRSNTSIHQSRIVPTPPEASSSESSLLLKDVDRKPISPFLSSSVPKGGESGGSLRRNKMGSDYSTLHGSIFEERTPSKPSGPRPPHTDRSIPRSPPPMPPLEEAQTPSSVTSLRRKLSVSWSKRGASKSGIVPPPDLLEKVAESGSKRDHMPTPRIPTSATLNCLPLAKTDNSSTISLNQATGFLDSKRRKSSNASLSNFISHDRTKSDTWNVNKEPVIDPSAVPAMPATRSTSVVHRLMRPKSSGTTLQGAASYTAELDKDDMLATEEMRKLGSRRKETEIAARTLDALKKRASPKERVSPQDAIRIAMLNVYERGEIIDHGDVYFCGTQNARKVIGDLQSDLPNFGYDDERGDYAIVIGDHIAYRYEIIDVLGKGSFGQVVRCIDHKLGILVAVKIIRNKKRFHQQALVEVKILEKLREWDPKNKHSMVNFTESFYFRGHLCISTELLDMNLYEFIKAHSFRGFSLRIIRRFTKQILSSLLLLKQHKVIHCDLKPENILLRHPLQSEIKVIDFGSSCFESEKVYTYIQSRFYRSPEVILGMTYGLPIDMWSVGCILAELFTGVPIFPGENEQEQLACIMEVFGPPEKHLIEKSTRKKLFFDSMGKPRLTVSSKGRRRRPSSKTLQQVLKCDDEAFVDFLARCLRWDPERRLKPEEAIRHEFITGIKAPAPIPRLPMRENSSPIKRHHTISVPRPLPDPPGNGGKMSASSSLRTGVSPHKPVSGSTRRVSGITAATTASINRRTSAGPAATAGFSTVTSGLPRAAGRSMSGRQDIAAAGATAAMNRRS